MKSNIRKVKGKKSINIRLLLTTFMLITMVVISVFAQQNTVQDDIIIEIEEGLSTKGIAKKLKSNKLISSEYIFVQSSIKKGYDKKYKSGKFKLNAKMSQDEIMEALTTCGYDDESIKVTIPEGYTIKQIGEKLEEKGICNKQEFYDAIRTEKFDYEFLKDIKVGENYLEGYLFPNTYSIKKGESVRKIIDMMLSSFEQNLDSDSIEKAKKMGYTLHEVITVASIIEREVKVEDERPLVAGVIYNRLKKGQKLQMCSTIQYILGEQKSKLYEKDLQIDSPYNTYIYEGLPVGPISNPGKSSIDAALNPSKHNYYYFVLKDEKTGTHIFSSKYDEHVNAKNKYIK